MCGGDVVDQVCRADEVADAPARAVEVFACGTDGEGSGGDGGREGGDAGEWGEGETVVDLELGLVGINGLVQMEYEKGKGGRRSTSSERMMRLCLTQRSPMAWSSDLEKILPTGLCLVSS